MKISRGALGCNGLVTVFHSIGKRETEKETVNGILSPYAPSPATIYTRPLSLIHPGRSPAQIAPYALTRAAVPLVRPDPLPALTMQVHHAPIPGRSCGRIAIASGPGQVHPDVR